MKVSENEQGKSKKDLLRERFQSKYPEENFDDEEAYYGKILNDFTDADDKIKKYQEDEKKISDMFSADPRSASVWAAWEKGEHPYVALVRIMGKDGLEAIVNDESMLEQLTQANEDYLKRVAEENKLRDEYEHNLEETLKTVDEKQEADGLSDEKMDEALNFLVGIVRDGLMGKFSADNIDMALKAINHDADVQEAAEEGEVKGRNTKIEEKLRTQKESDGLPGLSGKNGGKEYKQPESIFDVARGAS